MSFYLYPGGIRTRDWLELPISDFDDNFGRQKHCRTIVDRRIRRIEKFRRILLNLCRTLSNLRWILSNLRRILSNLRRILSNLRWILSNFRQILSNLRWLPNPNEICVVPWLAKNRLLRRKLVWRKVYVPVLFHRNLIFKINFPF